MSPWLLWLLNAFLRLHSRRPHHQGGQPLPLSHMEIADFAERTMQLPRDLRVFFSRAMEDIDDAVLSDHYDRVKRSEEAKPKKRQRGPHGA